MQYVVGGAAAAAAGVGSRGGGAADKSDTLCGVDLGTSKVDMAVSGAGVWFGKEVLRCRDLFIVVRDATWYVFLHGEEEV